MTDLYAVVSHLKDRGMIHYSCDRCKRILDPEDDLRYVVRVEVQAAMEPPELAEVDDERDHLLEIQEILVRLENTEDEAVGDDVYQRRRYDLCSECYRKYIKDPLGREAAVHLGFSEN